MNTDEKPKRGLTDEQKEIKNQKARENRLKKKLEKTQNELGEIEASKPVVSEPEDDTESIDNAPDPEVIRKREIAEKRRKTLEIARSKRVSPTQIRKSKDEELTKIREEKDAELMRMKEENEKLKAMADEKQKVKIVKKYVPSPVPVPIKKKKSPRPERVQNQEATIDYLTQQTYAEQLQKRMRESILQRVMADTFM
jgi:hypothetical protein